MLKESDRHKCFENRRTSMKVKMMFRPDDSDEEISNKKQAKKRKTKKLAELDKLAQYAKDQDLNSFVDCMADTLKQFEKMDPGIKNMIRNMFTDDSKKGSKMVVGSQKRSMTADLSKDSKRSVIRSGQDTSKPFNGTRTKDLSQITCDIKPTAPKRVRTATAKMQKYSVDDDKGWQNASLRDIPRSDSAEKLKAGYEYIVGYCAKFNDIKLLNRVRDSSVFIVKADSLLGVYQKMTHFVTDGNHRGNLSLLYCLLYGLPIISISWVKKCADQDSIVDWRPSEVKLDISHKIFTKHRISVYKDTALGGRLNRIVEVETKLLSEAIGKFGGILCEPFEADVVVVLDMHIEKLIKGKGRKDLCLNKVVNKKWIVDCILENFFKNVINPEYEIKISS